MTQYTREQHCTHPAQAFCDCDWCRWLTAYQNGYEEIMPGYWMRREGMEG